ncbi:MAG: glycerol-3-phosphate 1-O-acyltransferase PlsY [Betaproteobacteria bacterium]|nr:glycerol-3-phosphate 1-O-acyltransferase PlsY [Betaproteobacteria bacterium]
MGNVVPVIVAYLIGSIAFAVLVSKAFRLPDPHTYDSGNPGATNVLRTGHRMAAVLTLLGDALKGFVAVMATALLVPRYDLPQETVALAALAVFLGHLYPVFFRFKGGKGVATAAGILFAIHPWLGLLTLATWVVIALFFRYSSLAALIAAIFAPFFTFFLIKSSAMLVAVSAISLLLIWRHRANIRKLLAGEESRIGEKKMPAAGAAHSEPHSGRKSA